MITQVKAAEILDTSHTTVQRLGNDGILTIVWRKREGRRRMPRYRRSEVERLAAEWKAADADG